MIVADFRITYTSGGGSTTPTALSAPTNLSSSNVTATGATLSWDAVTNASSYTVKIGSKEYTGVNTNSYKATGLTASTQYTWTVKAVGDGANYSTSDYAANANFTTEAEQGGGDEPSGDGTWTLCSISDLTASDIFVIVDADSDKAMTNNNGTSSAPAATDVTISQDGKTITDVTDVMKWNISGDATDGYTFYPNGSTTTWLYCTATNNGVRVGTNTAKTFTLDGKHLKHAGTSRYVGVYNSQDWRCYTSNSGNIANTDTKFYKFVAEGGDDPEPEKTTPTLSFAPANATAYLDALKLFVAPTLTTDPENLSGVTYSMTGDNVGTINASTGALTLTAAGTATITASYAGDGKSYNAAEDASYTLTVNANAPEKTVAEFIASEGGICYLTGTVSNIVNTTYGNFDLTDETGTIYVYGCLTNEGVAKQFASLDVVAGDKIKVLANTYELYNETHEAKNVIFVEEIEIEKNKYTVTIENPENGTLVVKDGETVLTSGDQVEEGNTITIECTPTDAENYRYKNWQYKEDGNWITNTTTMTRVVTKDISIRANFELIPTYTINWSVNGAVVKTDENVKQGSALTAPEVSAINGKNFTGWVTTPTVDADATPEYATPATPNTEEPNEITYYAVFADGEGSGESKYELVESALDNWAGDYLIVYNNTYAMNTHSGNQNANTFATYSDISEYYTEATKSIASNSTTDALVYRAAQTTNGYSLYSVSDESYLGITANTTSTGSKLRWNTSYTESADDWTLGVGSIGNVGSNTLYIRWNNNSGSYRFAAYASNGQQAIQLFKKNGGASYSNFTTIPEVTFTSAGTINFVANDGEGNYYATFSSDKITAFPTTPSDDIILSAEAVYIDNDGTISKTDFYDDFESMNDDMDKVIIPANTGVLLHVFTTEDVAPSVNYEYTNAESEISEYDPEFNMLVPCTETAIFKKDADGNYYYKLAYGDNTKKTKLGFWWGATDGSGNFKVKAGGAILCVPQSAGVKGFSFDEVEDATAIEEVEVANSNDAIYNIAGQRIKATHNATGLRRGLYIVNGKKVMVK